MKSLRKLLSVPAWLSICAVAMLLACPATSRADRFSPQGTQQVLVIPMEFPSETSKLCPDPTLYCGTPAQLAAFTAPRHTASEWGTLFNGVPPSYYSNSTYGETKMVFTVLTNPNTTDGWWPAPHSYQSYSRNAGTPGGWEQWYVNKNTPVTYALFPDGVASVVRNICANPLLFAVCGSFPNFNRVILMINAHSFGGQTWGNDVPIALPTGVKTTVAGLATLNITGSVITEDTNDWNLTVALHELGHQLGNLSHYGDCSPVFSASSFNPTVPSGQIQCLGYGWDIMGYSYDTVEMSAYTRTSQGWLKAANTVYENLYGSFTKTVNVNPLESTPSGTQASAILLGYSNDSWPSFVGYHVECRQAIGGDSVGEYPTMSALGVGSLADEGVLITNVHEGVVVDGQIFYPAHHVERRLSPTDELSTATLKPGDSFNNLNGLTIKFVKYVQTANGTQCQVTVTNKPVFTPGAGKIQFAGYPRVAGSDQPGDSVSVAADIALDNVLPPSLAVSNPPPVGPIWVGHQNLVSVRVHNLTPVAANKVTVGMTAHSPVAITDYCGMEEPPGPARSVVVNSIPANTSVVVGLPWMAGNGKAISISATAAGPANQTAALSNFAFETFAADNSGADVVSLTLTESAACMMPETYHALPAVQSPGWTVKVEAQTINLSPGQSQSVTIEVLPPTAAQAGTAVQIPILVNKTMAMTIPANQQPAPFAGVHYMAVGAMTIFGRVTGGPGTIELSTPGQGTVKSALTVSGSIGPADTNAPVTIEYRNPAGVLTTHVVVTHANGAYTDSFTPAVPGNFTVQSWWPGDATHSPIESSTETVVVSTGS